MLKLHLFLTFDIAYKAVFINVQLIGFKNDINLEDLIVQAVLTKVDGEGRSKPFKGKKRSCEVCNSTNHTFHFKRRDTNKMFNILKGPLDCNYNHVIYFI